MTTAKKSSAPRAQDSAAKLEARLEAIQARVESLEHFAACQALGTEDVVVVADSARAGGRKIFRRADLEQIARSQEGHLATCIALSSKEMLFQLNDGAAA